MIVFSVAHTTTAKGAKSADGSIVENDFSRLVVAAALADCAYNGVPATAIEGGIAAKLAAIAKLNPICVVEPHLNTSPSATARGHMVIHTKGDSAEKDLAESLSDTLDNCYTVLGYRPKRYGPVEVPGPYVYRPGLPLVTDKGFTACIVECAFLTNNTDLEMLRKSEAPQAFGVALVDGVLAWLASRKVAQNERDYPCRSYVRR